MIRAIRSSIALIICAMACSSGAAERGDAIRAKAFVRLPDWSGIWEQFDIGPSGGPSQPAALQEFIAQLSALRPPYNGKWAQRVRTQSSEQPICTWGFPSLMLWSPLMFQIYVTPEETLLLFDDHEARRILTDKRTHPISEELFRTPWGDSVGHWEGATLVVDTIGSNAPLHGVDADGRNAIFPFSTDVHFSERLRLLDRDTLADTMIIEDPEALTQTWRLERRYDRVTTIDRMVDEECRGHDRNPVVDGRFVIAPP